MIERPGEFNAQILAFLTGDARYLEYIHPAPEEVVVEGQEEVAEAPYPGEAGEASTYVPSDDTEDLTPPPAEPDSERDSVPNVVRKQDGRYPARKRSTRPTETPPAAERPRVTRTRRESSDEHLLPELPDDLFDWPETRREFGNGDRHRDD
jgi:hypothetical protein